MNAKSTGHDKKRFTLTLAAFDDGQTCIPMITFKNLKKVSHEVKHRTDCCATVSNGGSMIRELLAVFIRKVWAKRPTKTPFRDTSLLGMDGHYSHVDESVLDA